MQSNSSAPDSKKTAFVFSGGGARGALQIGALQALLEAGIQPQMLVGTSIGAIHAAYLAIHGVHPGSIEALRDLWHMISRHDPLSTSPLRLLFSLMPDKDNTAAFQQIKAYLIDCGFSPHLRFRDITDIDLMLVSTDLSSGAPISFSNLQPEWQDYFVLDAILASICLMPWMRPIHEDGKQLVDGGLVCELPIEPAMHGGAGDIYALDLAVHPRTVPPGKGPKALIDQVVAITQFRQKTLSLSLAALNGVDVHIIELGNDESFSHTDFHAAHTLLQKGYTIAQQAISTWQCAVPS